MLKTTAGQLVINSVLPEEMRDYERVLDKKGIRNLLTTVAKDRPDEYREIVQRLNNIGRYSAYVSGGHSFGLEDIRTPPPVLEIQKELKSKIRTIYENKQLSPKEKEKQLTLLLGGYQSTLRKAVLDYAEKTNNPLFRQLKGAGRGNEYSLNSLLGADLLYTDHTGEIVPIPVLRNYAQGLSPVEYFAQSFGARKGIIDVKSATQDAGFLAKQLVQATHRLLVSGLDDENPYDELTPRGLPSSVDDEDNIGALLAHPIGGYTRNTILTPKILSDLKDQGHEKIIVRSPIAGGPKDGGVYARDVGIREKNRLAPTGDYVGIAAGQALSEPVTQAQICLAAGTVVRMEDGSVKPIEQIEIGDVVYGLNEDMDKIVPVEVIGIFDNGPRECVETVFRKILSRYDTDVILKSTLNHKLLTSVGVLPVGAFEIANAVVYDYDSDGVGYFQVISQKSIGEVHTYDIEVDTENHLFILENGLIVSNSSKHTGGIAGAAGAGAISGFKYINSLIQVPKNFPNGATHAQTDGYITKIDEAPQGGKYVWINGQRHYVGIEHGKQVPIISEIGQFVEAGDVISEGIPNPAEIVKHKGIGEGRKYFTDIFRKTLSDIGQRGHRRNIELLGRGLINYVKMREELNDLAPDDIVPYSQVENMWQARADAVTKAPSHLKNYYLEKPVLHYSVGTQLKPSVINTLKDYNVAEVTAHKDAPPFEPIMVRGMASVAQDQDWMTRMLGSYQKRSLLEGARRGAISDTSGSSYVPALAVGLDFGRKGLTKGFDPEENI